jgi:putative addiction module component (TIGR02574 family)
MTDLIERYGLGTLSLDDREALVDQLNESIAVMIEAEPESPEFLAELDRRIAHADAHPEDAIPWEEVYRKMRAIVDKS